jgi:hypothetical protein
MDPQAVVIPIDAEEKAADQLDLEELVKHMLFISAHQKKMKNVELIITETFAGPRFKFEKQYGT